MGREIPGQRLDVNHLSLFSILLSLLLNATQGAWQQLSKIRIKITIVDGCSQFYLSVSETLTLGLVAEFAVDEQDMSEYWILSIQTISIFECCLWQQHSSGLFLSWPFSSWRFDSQKCSPPRLCKHFCGIKKIHRIYFGTFLKKACSPFTAI